MAAYLESFRSPFVAGGIARPPSAIAQVAALGGSSYANPTIANAYGKQATIRIPIETGRVQATFDLPTRGNAARGLRVTVGAIPGGAGAASNGITVRYTQSGGLPTSFAYAGRAITGNARGSTTMSNLKASVDATAGLTSAYFGGETGTGDAGATNTVSAGGVDATADDSQGLEITIARAGLAADASNGVEATVEHGSASAVTFDAAGKDMEVDVLAGALLSAIKTLVDAETHLSSEYFGGETGTSEPGLGVFTSARGVEDQWMAVRIYAARASTNPGLHVFVGASAPANDNGSVYWTDEAGPFMAMVPPSQRIWFKRIGSSNVRGSIELWRGPGTAL